MRRSAHAFGYSGVNERSHGNVEACVARVERQRDDQLYERVGSAWKRTQDSAGTAAVLGGMIAGFLRPLILGGRGRAVVNVMLVVRMYGGMMAKLPEACMRGDLRKPKRRAAGRQRKRQKSYECTAEHSPHAERYLQPETAHSSFSPVCSRFQRVVAPLSRQRSRKIAPIDASPSEGRFEPASDEQDD